ncbi:uncharacterized protein LOC141633782 [Silene latifolia]|uniref:uncharacterized protein LOC141633782 n=1 Tax=Silene latifolia TaxID=37657 RepID=UPI003D7726C1
MHLEKMARLILRMVEMGERPSEEELVMVREVINKEEEKINEDMRSDDDDDDEMLYVEKEAEKDMAKDQDQVVEEKDQVVEEEVVKVVEEKAIEVTPKELVLEEEARSKKTKETELVDDNTFFSSRVKTIPAFGEGVTSKQQPCILSLYLKKGAEVLKVRVAQGYVLHYDQFEQVKVHGIALSDKCKKVEVHSLYNNKFAKLPVPFPNDEVATLGQAIRSLVQWPVENIHVVIDEVDMLKLTNLL